MSYISLTFLAFTLISLLCFYLVPQKAKNFILLLFSVAFYLSFSKYLIFVSLALVLLIYFLSLVIGKIDKGFSDKKKDLTKEERKAEKKKIKKKKKLIIFAECFVSFALLFVFKYLSFFTGIVNSFIKLFSSSQIPLISLLLPLGISYYTLSIVAYAVDVYRGTVKPEKNFFNLYLYTIYFPHIVEGPIGNYKEFSRQLSEPKKFHYDNFMNSVGLILIGLMKKMIIADRAGMYANPVFENYNEYGSLSVISAMILYSINIYFDFSGCMDLVRGVSGLYGIELPENFRQPFFSKNIQEFWRRWHITLGDWIKKYIFFSVSMSKPAQGIMNKCNKKIKSVYFKTTLPLLFSLLFVWLFNGIWHGSSAKYIVYGMYYYFIIVLGMLFEPLFKSVCKKLSVNRESKVFKLFQIVRTDILVVIGLAMFKAESISAFIGMLKRLLVVNGISEFIGQMLSKANLNKLDVVLLAFFVFIFILYSIKKEKGQIFAKRIKIPRAVWYTIMIIAIIEFGVYGRMFSELPFIYAQF